MAEYRRTSLEWARDAARAYRGELRKVAPERCAELDREALKPRPGLPRGLRWLVPTFVPPDAAEHAEDAVLSAKDIEQFWGVPAHSIWGWSSKGLLTNLGEKGRPRFRVSEVLEVEGRRRRSA